MPDGAALRPSQGQTPLVHEAQRRRREKSNSWRSASKASDPFGQARSRAPALGRPARSDLVLHQEPLDTRVVEAPTRAKRQTHAHSLPARGAVTVSVRRGQTPLTHSATHRNSPITATGLHAPKASDPGNTEARHRLAPLRRNAALPRASSFQPAVSTRSLVNPVRISWPDSVTTTWSSMRMPHWPGR